MKIWDRPRNTIRQFAEALASERGALRAEVIEQEILNALWRGEFESSGRCFVSLPEAAENTAWESVR